MIRIERGEEPPALRTARARRLPEARAAVAAGTTPVFDGYGVAKAPLHRAQHGKCAYCEMQQLIAAQPAEHFRPKAAVTKEHDQPTASAGYWWLAWSWNNLLFSCATCNSPGRKGNRFALEPGSIPLQPEQDPPGSERPMLIDPSHEDPLDHIVFVRDRPRHWLPRPRGGSARGKYTIDTLGLDSPDLADLYRDHVDHTVQPKLQELRHALKQEDAGEISRRWSNCLRRLFHPQTPFHGLSYDVLAATVPVETRTRWRLTLPRPGQR